MSPKDKRNLAASVRDRLLALARERGEEFQLTLTRYGLERLMYRLSQSQYADRFILKGAMLFVLWSDEPHRPTRDVDFLGLGDMSEDALVAVFREICTLPVEEDGVTFDPDTIRVAPIRDDSEYGGMRINLRGDLGGASIPVQVDIGIGDAVVPEPLETSYPILLDGPAPILRSYPRDTFVAEKYQAIVALGIANSRMKDYFDVWTIAREHSFVGATLSEALKTTFERRRTAIPDETPLGLGPEFARDSQKNSQWQAFVSRLGAPAADQRPALPDVCAELVEFLGPPTRAARDGVEWDANWPPGGPWS